MIAQIDDDVLIRIVIDKIEPDFQKALKKLKDSAFKR